MKTLLGGLPFLATALWSAVWYFRAPEAFRSLRWSLAMGCLLLGSFSLVATEMISALHLLSFAPVMVTWSLFTVLPLLLLLQQRGGMTPVAEVTRLRSKIQLLPIWALVILSGTTLLIVLMGVATPPMNDDVQIYHLPRQIYWMMQGSVESFSASHTHQISMPVLSEFLGLNLLILSGGDAWHNLVQMFFLLAACGVVTLMTRSLGGTPRAQILSLLFVVFVPFLFFEASNAKNDIVLAFFMLVPLVIGIRIWTREWSISFSLLLLAALGAGLALATKGTAVVYLVASALLIVMACIRGQALRILLLAALPALLLALLPASPQLMRNWQVFHSLAGPNLYHSNLHHDPASIAGVALRNAAELFITGNETWDHLLESKTRDALTLIGISPDDEATTFVGQKFHLPYYAGMEDTAPAPVQTGLLLLLPLAFLSPSFRRSCGILPLFAATALTLLLFCLIFRWQPWQGRLLIPAYFMVAPLAGILGDLIRPRWLPIAFTLLELFTLRPHLMFSGQRPLLGGESIFRTSQDAQMSRLLPGRAKEIEALGDYLRQQGASRILIDGGATDIYGLLRGLYKALPLATLISGYADQPGTADAVILPVSTEAGAPPLPATNPPAPPHYKASWIGDYYRVFLPSQKDAPKTIAAHFAGFEQLNTLSEPIFYGRSLRQWGRSLGATKLALTLPVSSPSELQMIIHGQPGTHLIMRLDGAILLDETLEKEELRLARPVLPSLHPEELLTLEASNSSIWLEKLTVTKK